ncbi:MAG: 2,3-bisphosphoglycerate-independent phosphoglycerate mutase [bacterium]|jgi:2,3-bisphosphoglycerate-independent phosphoglycerate mutase
MEEVFLSSIYSKNKIQIYNSKVNCMNEYQKLVEHFKGRGPIINIVLDGYGLGKQDHSDAVFQANTPYMDYLKSSFANTTLATHGEHVGLPSENDLGGSEVGHLTLGAGTIIEQGPAMIKRMLDDGSFYKLPVLNELLEKAQGGALHLLGLLSDGNVHSHVSHFEAVIREAAKRGVKKCYIHALVDGRDVGIQSALDYTSIIEKVFEDILASNPTFDYRFASAGGREVMTMDRDQNWAKVEKGWNCHVLGKSDHRFNSMEEAITFFREQNPDLIDQDCPPFNIKNQDGHIPTIQDNDAVLMMNFRADRAIEIARVFTEEGFDGFDVKRPDVYFAGMMVYDEDTDMPKNRIMDSPSVDNPFGKRILEYGLDQFRLTETQKFAHVTFFYNGGYRNPLDAKKENYHLINSDRIDSFANAPKMKAFEIAAQAEKFIAESKYNFGLINFANADMVGHTGLFNESVQAVETVDVALKRVCEAIKKVNGIALITADHGNADEMIITNKKTGKEEMCTKHSLNMVPCVIFDPLYKQNYQLKQSTHEDKLNLSMVSATNHVLMGRTIPTDLNDSLFSF